MPAAATDVLAATPESKPRRKRSGGRPCFTCNHPQRANIEAAILSGRSVLGVANDYKLNASSVGRHMDRHCRRDVQSALVARNGVSGLTLLARIQESHNELKAILERAKGTNELTVAVNAIQGGLRALELEGKVTGEISSGGTHINVLLGVRIEDAKRSVETVAAAQTMPEGDIAERALRCLERMRLSHEQAERLRACAERAERASSAEVIE